MARMASFLDTETSSESESSLDDGTRGQSQMTYNSSNEDDLSSELDAVKSLPNKPKKKRRRYGSGSAKEKLHPSNGRTINSTPKQRTPGKENQPITPTTRKKKIGESSSCPAKESTRLSSKRSALARVRACIEEPTESDERQVNEPPDTCEELRKTNELLAKLISQVSKTQRRVAALEEKLDTSISSSTSSSGSSKKRSKSVDVPNVVRRETRRVYALLENEDDDFEGWIIAPGVSFKSPRNQAVLNKLMKEVKGLNSDFKTEDIREAAYRYYKSSSEQESIRRRGKAGSIAQKKRAHERISRKLQERTATLEKMTFSDPKKKDKWREALHVKLMSSEESAVEGDLEVIQVKPLPWRSEEANDILRRLDDRILSDCSPQSRRQAKKRIQGDNSSRTKPIDELPAWLFN